MRTKLLTLTLPAALLLAAGCSDGTPSSVSVVASASSAPSSTAAEESTITMPATTAAPAVTVASTTTSPAAGWEQWPRVVLATDSAPLSAEQLTVLAGAVGVDTDPVVALTSLGASVYSPIVESAAVFEVSSAVSASNVRTSTTWLLQGAADPAELIEQIGALLPVDAYSVESSTATLEDGSLSATSVWTSYDDPTVTQVEITALSTPTLSAVKIAMIATPTTTTVAVPAVFNTIDQVDLTAVAATGAQLDEYFYSIDPAAFAITDTLDVVRTWSADFAPPATPTSGVLLADQLCGAGAYTVTPSSITCTVAGIRIDLNSDGTVSGVHVRQRYQ